MSHTMHEGSRLRLHEGDALAPPLGDPGCLRGYWKYTGYPSTSGRVPSLNVIQWSTRGLELIRCLRFPALSGCPKYWL